MKNNDTSNSNDLSIKPYELKKKIDRGEDIFILDVRNLEEHESWKISYDKYPDSHLIPIDNLSLPQSLRQIPQNKEIVTFCARGNRSMNAAKILSKYGYKVKSIEGGLNGWSNVYDIAIIVHKNSSIKIWQIRRISKGCISYLIACSLNRSAILIDATCEIDSVINDILNENNLKLTKVLDTHVHADHLSGATRLAKKYGSVIYLSSLEDYNIKNSDHSLNFKFISDGDTIQIENEVYLEAVHTPGHTNGSLSLKLQNKLDNISEKEENKKNEEEKENHFIKKDKNNMYFFVGDTIFINGVGRPDLHDKTKELAHQLFNTYQKKIMNLPEETIILSSHYNDTFEHEKPVYDTIKSIKQKINVLSASEEEFNKFFTENISPRPVNYKEITHINKHMIKCDEIEQKDIEAGPNSCGIVK
jgi:glyoxylase-like metal-dependent hydrolase (beta-lactamase superfamily II)/rhodanese-related sulfurtransferase